MSQPTDLHTELSALLANLPGERFCYLDEGALKTRLIASYSDQDDATPRSSILSTTPRCG